jgi:hypothetical protein
MTGYTVHTGSTEKFADGWDRIFRQRSAAKPSTAKKPRKANASRKKVRAAGKPRAKKASRR